MTRVNKGNLVQQPTARPTRKWIAMILAGMIVGGVNTFLNAFWPGHPFAPLMQDFGMYVQLGILGVVTYFTRNRQI